MAITITKAAAQDRSGGLTAILGVCVGLGSSVGPNLAVVAMGDSGNFLIAGTLGAVLCLIGGATQASPERSLARGARQPATT